MSDMNPPGEKPHAYERRKNRVLKDKLIPKLVKHSKAIMIVNLLLLAVVAYGMSQLTVQSGSKIFFSEDDPNLIAQEQLEQVYGKPDNILFVLDAGVNEIFSRETLDALEQITTEAWQIPYSRRVDSIANYQHPSVDGDDIVVESLVSDANSLSDEQIAEIRKVALQEPLLAGRLIATDGRVAAVNVSLNMPDEGQPAAIAESVKYARELADSVITQFPDIEIHLAGWIVTEQSLAEVTMSDGTRLVPILVAIVLVLLAFLLRSAGASVLTLLIIVLSVVTGMGYAGWAGIAINTVNISAPTIIMTLAVADCVHIFSAFFIKLRTKGDKAKALEESLSATIYPVFLTSVTTAFGFLSMNMSESPPFQELGTISAVGVIGALWIVVMILPGLIMVMPFRSAGKPPVLVLNWLATLLIRHRNVFFYGSLIVVAIAISFITRMELNDDPASYFSEQTPLTKAITVIEHKLSGTQSIEYSMNTNMENGIMSPDFLQRVDAFANWLRAQPEVSNVAVFSDTLKRLNQVMNDNAEEWRKLPDSQPLAAQYTLLYEMSVPYGLDISSQVNMDKSSMKLEVTLKNQKSAGLIAFEEKSRVWREQNVPSLATRGSGPSFTFANVGLRNINSMLYGSFVAIILISLSLALAFRSIKYGVISLIPNLFPAFCALGVWAAFVGEVNVAASVVFSLTLGIIVDDTTHFLVKYLEARNRANSTAEEAIVHAFSAVGGALVTTSIVLVAGFLVLTQSEFLVSATAGMLVAITIAVAIILDLTFLPAVLLKADRWLCPQGR